MRVSVCNLAIYLVVFCEPSRSIENFLFLFSGWYIACYFVFMFGCFLHHSYAFFRSTFASASLSSAPTTSTIGTSSVRFQIPFQRKYRWSNADFTHAFLDLVVQLCRNVTWPLLRALFPAIGAYVSHFHIAKLCHVRRSVTIKSSSTVFIVEFKGVRWAKDNSRCFLIFEVVVFDCT